MRAVVTAPASIDRLLAALRRARPPATLCDGITFSRGAVWMHTLGASARLGLVAFGNGGFSARFDHVNARSLPAPAAQ